MNSVSTATATLKNCRKKSSRRRKSTSSSIPHAARKSRAKELFFRRLKRRAPERPKSVHSPAMDGKEKSGEKMRQKFRRKLPQAKKNRRKEQKNPKRYALLFWMAGPVFIVS